MSDANSLDSEIASVPSRCAACRVVRFVAVAYLSNADNDTDKLLSQSGYDVSEGRY